jgi:hypothetical protein
MRHFEDNAVSITEDQMDVKEDGEAGITYWAHGLKAICPGEIYDELVAILKGGTQKLLAKKMVILNKCPEQSARQSKAVTSSSLKSSYS